MFKSSTLKIGCLTQKERILWSSNYLVSGSFAQLTPLSTAWVIMKVYHESLAGPTLFKRFHLGDHKISSSKWILKTVASLQSCLNHCNSWFSTFDRNAGMRPGCPTHLDHEDWCLGPLNKDSDDLPTVTGAFFATPNLWSSKPTGKCGHATLAGHKTLSKSNIWNKTWTTWWFQAIWKTLVTLEIFPK